MRRVVCVDRGEGAADMDSQYQLKAVRCALLLCLALGVVEGFVWAVIEFNYRGMSVMVLKKSKSVILMSSLIVLLVEFWIFFSMNCKNQVINVAPRVPIMSLPIQSFTALPPSPRLTTKNHLTILKSFPACLITQFPHEEKAKIESEPHSPNV